MFDTETLKTHQQFLKDLGFYTGEIDGIWGPLSRNAMAGYAFIDSAGNQNGEPFTTAPADCELINGCVVQLNAPKKEKAPATKTESKPQKDEVVSEDVPPSVVAEQKNPLS